MSENYFYLKLLLRNNLLLNLDEYALSNVAKRGLVCQFLGMNLASAFQPIVDAAGKVLGREALLRASLLEHGELSPETAFEDAIQAERLVQFDRLVRTLHVLNHSRNFADDELLFLNVHPHLLTSVNDHGHTFEQILHYYAVPTSQVVIEIKHAAVADQTQLAQAIQNYRKLGYKIAVDDFGSAQSGIGRVVNSHRNYRSLVEDNHELKQVFALRPDIVKLDRAVIHAAAQQRSADSVLTGLVNIFHKAGIQVAIEGIETDQQLDIAKKTGADFLQGYYLGQPEFSRIPEHFDYSERLAA
jgi:EAL domain-containing protein (putative c-di-GMP-specific phosphodiesterase class I)